MEFLNEEKQTELGLTPEQVSGLSPLYESHLAELKQGWDGKANENAEGIINGVIKSTQKTFGVELEREQGEKHADYLARLSSQVLETKKSDLESKIKDYDAKVSNFKGSEDILSELDKMKSSYSELQKKEAEYDELLKSGIKDKYEELSKEHYSLSIDTSFNAVKPSFPQEANEYEVAAKWNAFKKSIVNDYDLKNEDGEIYAISKENEHKKVKLKDLVDSNSEISELAKGRQQNGIAANQINASQIDGIPFKIDVNMEAKDRHQLIQNELMKKYPITSDKYASEFKRINDLVLEQQTAK